MKLLPRLILTALAAYAAYAAFAMLCTPTFGQPAPPPPATKPLPVFYVQGMKFQAGGTYVVYGPLSATIDAPGVTIVGLGKEWPVWPVKNAGAALSVRADNVKISNVYGDYPGPPDSGAIGIAPLIRDFAKGTRVENCTGATVDTFCEAWPTSVGLTLYRCATTSDLRAGAFFSAGASGATVDDCDFIAKNENTVRWSPQNGQLSRDALVKNSRISNIGRKAAVEFRNVTGAEASNNFLAATRNNSCVGVGRAHVGDPGAENIVVRGNRCFGGSITIHAMSRGVRVENNVPMWTEKPDNCFITVDASSPGLVQDLRVTGNWGVSPVPQKVMIGIQGSAANIAGYLDSGNGWAVGPATQPVGPN